MPKPQNHRINPYRLFTGSNIPNWLLCRPELSGSAKIVYARLCQYAGEHGVAYPRREILAGQVGLTPSQIDRHIRRLTKLGLLEVERLGLGRSNRYFFLDHEWMHVSAPKTLSDARESAFMRTPESAFTLTPLKRIIEENHRADARLDPDTASRIDSATSSPKKSRRTIVGLKAAVAQNFGRRR